MLNDPTRVVVADRRYEERGDLYSGIVNEHEGVIRYADCETEEDTIDQCADAEILVVSKSPITPTVLEELDDLQLVIRMGTGYDNVNVKAATEHGVLVSNTPGYSKHEVATHGITLMLAAAREVVYSDQSMREANGWGERRPINRMYEGTYGIVGLGRIGRAAVPKAKGLDMDVIAYDPYVERDVCEKVGVQKVTFDELLGEADCVSIHAPLTAETYHMFSSEEFEKMKDSAVLVNTARGPIVDESALIHAVEEREIFAAGLDVFEQEPPKNSPILEQNLIVCSPHHAGRCDHAQQQNIEILRSVLANALQGNHLEHIVNQEVLQYTEEQLNPEYQEWSDN